MNLIYAYKKKIQNKIVYVGQTVQLEVRHKQHMLYDPYNPNNREYDYPLSRGVRKYGADAYELIILEENVPLDQLDVKEKYWINYYDTYWHGYNQTMGGASPTKPFYSDNIIDLVTEMLKDEAFSYNDIAQKTNMSLTHIYNINIGARRTRSDIIYPIRPKNTKGTKGIKFNQDELKKIHKALLTSNKNYKTLAVEFNCSANTISKINRGLTQAYKLPEYNYPLRPHPHSTAKQFFWEQKNK